ncbi:DUF4252 domain-containing protein [Dyadobacter chenwenxiniae]|uniref:DUF4252 domain-containing protein n=1 Tax=Dyadobacter chenwenxiniae TaxID=2906456 RepID=A0A9X1TM80_9BACT|nr:DUF4252 domain-containing protein [Dyadobacter chenwenxiniae]MCF0063208.1 DUF4252 domain-containing protein [Dyadobacter chenwenxiniae]UON85412.1 DUF4252 domain-containing protein [Dyadobacter chenwenxiniae]
MKRICFIYIILFSSYYSFGQDKLAPEPNQTFIDLYFKQYAGMPGYSVNTMGEAMVKRSNETGMWSHPSIARIMKQVKTYKYLSFDSSPEKSNQIISQLDTEMKKSSIYKEYYRWELNGKTSGIIYTRSNGNKITELVNVSVGKKNFLVSSFLGDNIDLESVRSLAIGR